MLSSLDSQRANSSPFVPQIPHRSSPRKRGPRSHWRRLWVPGLASLARDTKTWIPACAGMSGGGGCALLLARAARLHSLRADTGRADRLRPALNLHRQKLGEVLRRAPLRRHDFEPEFLEPRANGGIVERL